MGSGPAGTAVGGGQGRRGRRKGTRVAAAVVLLVVAAALAAASVAMGVREMLWVALALGVAAALLIVSGRVARKTAPPHDPEDKP